MKLRFSIGPAGCRSDKVLSDCMMYFSNHTIAEIYIIVAAPLVLAVTPTRVAGYRSATGGVRARSRLLWHKPRTVLNRPFNP